MGHGLCDHLSRSINLPRYTDEATDLSRAAIQVLTALRIPPNQLRGLAVSLSKLDVNAKSGLKGSGGAGSGGAGSGGAGFGGAGGGLIAPAPPASTYAPQRAPSWARSAQQPEQQRAQLPLSKRRLGEHDDAQHEASPLKRQHSVPEAAGAAAALAAEAAPSVMGGLARGGGPSVMRDPMRDPAATSPSELSRKSPSEMSRRSPSEMSPFEMLPHLIETIRLGYATSMLPFLIGRGAGSHGGTEHRGEAKLRMDRLGGLLRMCVMELHGASHSGGQIESVGGGVGGGSRVGEGTQGREGCQVGGSARWVGVGGVGVGRGDREGGSSRVLSLIQEARKLGLRSLPEICEDEHQRDRLECLSQWLDTCDALEHEYSSV